MKLTLSIITTAALLFGGVAYAQMPHPTPAPELKKLDYFLGNWKMDVDTKASSFGPGGKATGTEHYEWMQGNFYMISHSTYSSQSMGSGIEYAVLGYDSAKKEYTYESFNSDGEHEVATGMPDADGKVWTWYSSGESPMPMKWRFTETVVSPTSYTIRFDMSQDGKTWSNVMEGKVTKE
jgi:Protein of unknown function (DUF1579)